MNFDDEAGAAAGTVADPLGAYSQSFTITKNGYRNNVHELQPVIPINHKQHASSISDIQTPHSFNALPRSVRWRIHLRILSRPSATDVHSIQEVNASKLAKQRSRYTELERTHYWRSTPTCIANDTTPTTYKTCILDGTSTNGLQKMDMVEDSQHLKSLHQVAPGNDPLSALLTTVEFPQRSSSTTTKSPVLDKEKVAVVAKAKINSKEYNPSLNNNSRDENHGEEKEQFVAEQQAGRRRWAEFYSTREDLDVIKKDLDRLPPDHYTLFHAWRMMRIRDSQKWKENDGDGKIGFSRRQQQSCVFHNSTAENKIEMMEDEQVHKSIQVRAERMSQILFVYAREYPAIGYRQGMHEVLDYVMLAFEGDILLLDQEQAMTMKKGKSNNGVGEHCRLIDPEFILHDAFTVFECIMASLASAYDAIVPSVNEYSGDCTFEALREKGDSSPLEHLTASIMTKLQLVGGDEELCNLLLKIMPVPPNLYFAKWIRLMFVREVAGGMENALSLLDAFFELAWSVSSFSSTSSGLPINVALLDVWKATACGMIILIRHKLVLSPTVINNGTMMGHHMLDPNIGIGYLMNYPPMEDSQPLVDTIVNLLIKEKKLSNVNLQLSSTARKSHMQQLQLSEDQLSQPSATSSIPSSDLSRGEEDKYHPDRTSANGQHSMFHHSMKQRLPPQRPITNEMIPRTKQTVAPATFNHEMISGTIGNIAEGIIDFSKTASAAITSFHKQFKGHSVSASSLSDHPLKNDAMIPSRGRTSVKSAMQLASTLETSSAVLMKYFNDQLIATSEEELGPITMKNTDGGSQYRIKYRSSTTIIPDDVWDAMAKIDLVRKELLNQADTTSSPTATGANNSTDRY